MYHGEYIYGSIEYVYILSMHTLTDKFFRRIDNKL